MRLNLFFLPLLPLFVPLGAMSYVLDGYYSFKNLFLGRETRSELTSFAANDMPLIYVRHIIPKEMKKKIPVALEDLIVGFSFPESGFDKYGFHPKLKVNIYTLCKYDRGGYDLEGYDRAGYNRKGYDSQKHTINDYDSNGYSRRGWSINNTHRDTGTKYDRLGYDRWGYDRRGWHWSREDNTNKYTGTKYDRNGYNRMGYNKEGYNRNGYNGMGYNKEGYDRDGYNGMGYNKEGYDRKGSNPWDYNKNGERCYYKSLSLRTILAGEILSIYVKGIAPSGIKSKINKDTENLISQFICSGPFNKEGFSLKPNSEINAYTLSKYDLKGFDKKGFNSYLWNKQGLHKKTKTRFDTEGYDRKGYDRNGYNRWGVRIVTIEKGSI